MNSKRPAVVVFALLCALWILTVTSRVLGQGGGRETTKPSAKPTTPAKKTNAPSKRNDPARAVTCSAPPMSKPSGRTHTVSMGNGVTMEFVEIPAGIFCMGSNNGAPDEKPVHRVTFNKPYYLGKYEVTEAQWEAVMGKREDEKKGKNYPIELVLWNEAQKFIDKLNALHDSFTYRLPSEAEWEYACHAGTITGIGAGERSGGRGVSPMGRTHPVGQSEPNGFGLFDMIGNVSEWVQDRYHDSYRNVPSDGAAVLTPDTSVWLIEKPPNLQEPHWKQRVRRGGWLHAEGDCSFRSFSEPDQRIYYVGFRVAAVPR